MSNHDLSSACWNKDDIQWCWYLHSCGECSYQRHSFPFFSSDSMFNCSFFQFSHSIVFSTLFKIRMQCAKSYSTGNFLMEVVAWKSLTAVNWCPASKYSIHTLLLKSISVFLRKILGIFRQSVHLSPFHAFFASNATGYWGQVPHPARQRGK